MIFYLIEHAAGFAGLSLFFLAVSAATLWFFFTLAARYGSFALAVLLTIIVMPVLITRHEIRPEMFSYLILRAVFALALGLSTEPSPPRMAFCSAAFTNSLG